MARIKPKRHGVVTDMTAMCDVAFLLLTFFILTTEFKQPDVEDIVTPSSISKSKLTEGDNTMTISVTKDGRYYFSPTNNPSQRVELLEKMGEKYNITFNENFAENNLDTYRNWLHLRSLCPDCKVNGMQLSNLNYRCLACFREWSNNDSRFKRLHKKIKK